MVNVRMRRTPLMAGSVVGAAALLLAACGGGGDSGERDAPGGPVDLRMVMWSANEGHHEVFDAIADAYVEEHSDTVSSISFEALTGASYVNALTTQIAGGDAPDLAWISEANAAQFVQSGVLYDLTPTLEEAEGYNLGDLLDSATETWTQGGSLYAYPFSNSPFGIYVNLDLLAAAGQPNPRDLLESGGWTWDAVMDIAQATAASQGVGGFVSSADPYTDWNNALGAMWMSWGAQPWSEDGTTCEFTSPEMVDFFDWFHGEAFVERSTPGPGEEFNFSAGEAAIQMAQLSASTGLDGSFAWDYLPMPEGPAGQVDVVGQAGVGVVARGDNPQAAADFLAYFTNEANSAQLAKFFPPPRESLLTVETISQAAPTLNEEQIQATIIDAAHAGITKPGHVAMSDVSEKVRVALDALWVPDGDAATVLDQVCSDIEPIIAGS